MRRVRKFGYLLSAALVLTAGRVQAAPVGSFTDGITVKIIGEEVTRPVELKDKFTLLSDSWTDEDETGMERRTVKELYNAEETSRRFGLEVSIPVWRFNFFAGGGGLSKFSLDGVFWKEVRTSSGTSSDYESSYNSSGPGLMLNNESDEWSGFFGSTGIKARLYQGGFNLDFGGRYSYQESDGYVLNEREHEGYYRSDDYSYRDKHREKTEITDVTTQEVQISLVISHDWDNLHPYAGVKGSWYESRYKGTTDVYSEFEWEDEWESESVSTDFSFTTQAKEYVSIFVGCSYKLTENMAANMEFSIGAETATSLGFGYQFN